MTRRHDSEGGPLPAASGPASDPIDGSGCECATSCVAGRVPHNAPARDRQPRCQSAVGGALPNQDSAPILVTGHQQRSRRHDEGLSNRALDCSPTKRPSVRSSTATTGHRSGSILSGTFRADVPHGPVRDEITSRALTRGTKRPASTSVSHQRSQSV